jgi:MFS transporter, OFA family, oxalate/formate antiporter
MQVLLGVVYSWTVFRGPLTQAYGWSNAQTIAPYSYVLLMLALGMIVGGFWQDRSGPRRRHGRRIAAWRGMGALRRHRRQAPGDLVLSYGVLVGLGTGFAYVTPIATLLKWFPDKRGMIVGLGGDGRGRQPAAVRARCSKALLGADPAQYASTIPRTFLILAAVLRCAALIGAGSSSALLRPGWRPAGLAWTPAAAAIAARGHHTTRQMLSTWQFYMLWIVYFLGTSVGLTAIGETAPQVREMAKTSAALSGGLALGIMSVFNGVGRLAWGSVSDRLGRTRALIAMCLSSAFACVFLLRQATDFWQLLAGLCLAAFAYGGYLALMPSLTADYYGPKHVGATTAWSSRRGASADSSCRATSRA